MRLDDMPDRQEDALPAELSQSRHTLPAMAHRRPDPERLYEAHRAGHLSRLEAQAKLSPERAR